MLLPGTGTMIASLVGYDYFHKTHFIIGVIQLLTSVYLVGWIWSIYWGYLLVVISKGNSEERVKLMEENKGTKSEGHLQLSSRNQNLTTRSREKTVSGNRRHSKRVTLGMNALQLQKVRSYSLNVEAVDTLSTDRSK